MATIAAVATTAAVNTAALLASGGSIRWHTGVATSAAVARLDNGAVAIRLF